jgi:hypothetical protein
MVVDECFFQKEEILLMQNAQKQKITSANVSFANKAIRNI